jgi:hypothetical protein
MLPLRVRAHLPREKKTRRVKAMANQRLLSVLKKIPWSYNS